MDPDDARKIVAAMMENDMFSKWLGIEILDIGVGSCVLAMRVRKDMLNGFSIGHGGIVYSLADSALAFAANTHGAVSVALANTITYPLPVQEGDILTANCSECASSKKTGTYDVVIRNQEGITVALFRGTVYRKSEQHPVLNG